MTSEHLSEILLDEPLDEALVQKYVRDLQDGRPLPMPILVSDRRNENCLHCLILSFSSV